VDRADVAALTAALSEAFLAAGNDIRERRTVTGSAFLVDGRVLGQIDVRSSVVRVRLWLPEKDRRTFETRPTFDPESGWLHVVSEDDIRSVRSLLPVASRAAASGSDTAPPSPRGIEVGPTSPAVRAAPSGGTVGGAAERGRAAPARRPRRKARDNRTA
jgi:hypothetical protein